MKGSYDPHYTPTNTSNGMTSTTAPHINYYTYLIYYLQKNIKL